MLQAKANSYLSIIAPGKSKFLSFYLSIIAPGKSKFLSLVTAPISSSVKFISQKGVVKEAIIDGSNKEAHYVASSGTDGDRYVRVEVKNSSRLRSWSQPIFFAPQGSISSTIDAGEEKSMGLHGATLEFEPQPGDRSVKLSLPDEMLTAPSPPGITVVGDPYLLEIEEGSFESPASISISYEFENLVPYLEPALAIYYFQEESSQWIRLHSNVEKEQKRVTAEVSQPGWYVIGADLATIFVPMSANPEISIVPPEGAEPFGSPFEVGAEIATDTGIWKIDFYLDDIHLGYDIWPDDGWGIEIDPSCYVTGQHVIKAVAEDLTGSTAEAQLSVSLTGGISAPSVTITTPEPDTVLGSTVLVEGSFNTDTDLATVIVGIDDVTLNEGIKDGNKWSCHIPGGIMPTGTYELWAEVRDEYGNSAKSIIPVNIGPILKLSVAGKILPVGDNREIYLVTGGLNDNLCKVEATLCFDPEQLEIIEIEEGNYFAQDEAETSFDYDLNALEGTVSITAERSDGSPALGNGGSIATITVSAKLGASYPEITVNDTGLYASHPHGTAIEHTTAGVTFLVNSPPTAINFPDSVLSSVGSTFTYQVNAVDPDGDDISYQLMSDDLNYLEGMSIDNVTGVITWPEPRIGQFKATLLLKDGQSPAVHREFEIFSVKYGSVKCDGLINVGDAILVLRRIVGLATLEPLSEIAADVNGDSKIDVGDAILILRKIVGLIDKFPVEE